MGPVPARNEAHGQHTAVRILKEGGGEVPLIPEGQAPVFVNRTNEKTLLFAEFEIGGRVLT